MYSSLNGIRQHFKSELRPHYSDREIERLFYRLLETMCNISKTDAVLDMHKSVDQIHQEELIAAIDKLKSGVPVQYIDNTSWFMGERYFVDEHVLIPRPETEELVRLILDNHGPETLQLLDIGTGSGIIPIALSKQRPMWDVKACDISNEALFVARKNANAILKEPDIAFYKEDALAPSTRYPNKLDIIVSNPPYVLESDKSDMQEQVLKHEPHLALFVPDSDPLLFYKAIVAYAKENLRVGGYIYFEIHEAYGGEIVALLEKNQFAGISVSKDLQDKPRMATGVLI